MNNQEIIYTLFFVLEDSLQASESIIQPQTSATETLDRDKLFQKFFKEAKRQYSDLHYDLVAEIGSARTKAEDEFGKLTRRIQSTVAQLKERRNLDLVFTLWIALELALSFYFSQGGKDLSWSDNLAEKVKLANQQYLSLSQANSENWQQTDAMIKSKLGNF